MDVKKKLKRIIHINICPVCSRETLSIDMYNKVSEFKKRRVRGNSKNKDFKYYLCSNPLCDKGKKIYKGDMYIRYKSDKFHLVCSLKMKALVKCSNDNCNFIYIININKMDEKMDVYGKLVDIIKLDKIKYAVKGRIKREKGLK